MWLLLKQHLSKCQHLANFQREIFSCSLIWINRSFLNAISHFYTSYTYKRAYKYHIKTNRYTSTEMNNLHEPTIKENAKDIAKLYSEMNDYEGAF